MLKKIASIVAVCLFATQMAQAAVIESFDSGSWGAGWSNTGAGVVNTASAHDGTYGVSMDGSSWTYNTSILFAPGGTLSAWLRPTQGSNGRFYLGFGADGSGADSFIAATNTQDIRFQHNPGFSFNELNFSSQSWSNSWYFMSVSWHNDGTAVGNLFGSDGTTLINSVTQSGLTRSTTGIALRGFGGFDVDTVSVAALVPEPESYTLLLAGLGLLGFMSRRRKQNQA